MLRNTQTKSFCSNLVVKAKCKLGYFGDNSNVHGVEHVMSLTPIPFYKRIFWLLILVASGVCASRILLQVLSLYTMDAVSYFIETDYLEFNTPFPAVTLCEQSTSNGSWERVKAFGQKNNLSAIQNDFLKELAYWNSKFCKKCFTSDQFNQTYFKDFYNIAKEIRAPCNTLLTDCWWDDKPFRCCERFLPVNTEYGVCFVFNSRLTGNETTLTVNRKIGLPKLVFTATEEIGIRIHSPDDMVSVGMENILGHPIVVPSKADFEAIVTAEQTVYDEAVTTMPPDIRGCLFKNERPVFAAGWPSNRYSFSTCALYCRAWKQFELCNCSHYLMPKIGDIPQCNFQGLSCLNQQKDFLGTVMCECPMSCEEISYKLVHIFMRRDVSKSSSQLGKRGCRGTVRLGILPSFRVRRTAIRHNMGLVVDIGGIGGVFFGASLLSVIEIAYLCCMRRQK